MITKKRVRSTNRLSVNVQYSTSEFASQHTCFQPSYVFATYSHVFSVCVCVFATDKGSAEDQRSRDGLVCCRLCLTSFPRCRIKSSPPLPPPPPHLLSLALLLWPDSTNRKEMERHRDSGLDVTSRLSEPPAEFQLVPLCLPNWSETTCVAVFTG